MSDARPPLDDVVALLRSATPRATEDDDTRVVAAAMLAGAARYRRRVVTRTALGALALAAALALGALVPTMFPRAPTTAVVPALPSRITLASGDVLTAVAGTHFTVERTVAGTRRVHLDHGALLCDVRRLAAGEQFEVVTDDSVVRVTGTVFAVAAIGHTAVHVYEGHVQVHDAAGDHALAAGEALGSPSRALEELAEAGRTAAAARATLAQHTAVVPRPSALPSFPSPSLPSPMPAPVAVVADSASSAADLRPEIVRSHIATGRAALALRESHARTGGEWRFVEADALRALRRFREAATTYDDAARQLAGAEQAQAAYLAAVVHLDELNDANAALSSLDAAAVDADDAPLRERGLVLRGRALAVLHEEPALDAVARAYLASYPHGSRAEWMRTHLAR